MRYNEVSVKTWVSSDFRRLSEHGKLLWLYLLTGPVRQQAPGIYRAGIGVCSDDLGWDRSVIESALKELTDAGMVQRDDSTNVIYLPNWPKYNRPPANPNVLKSWLNILDCIPDCELKDNYIQELRGVIESAENSSASLDVFLLWVKPLKPVKTVKKVVKRPVADVSKELTKISETYHKGVKDSFPNLSIFKNGGMSFAVRLGAIELDKLVRINEYSVKDIKKMLEWVISSYDDTKEFNWLPNLQSLRSVRNRSKNGNIKYDNICNSYETDAPKEQEIDYSDGEPF